MHIHLKGFRSHLDSTYVISDNQVTLVRGVSGAGKSTIFQGLAWCLYGGMQHVYNNVNPTQCSVEVTMSDLVIYRQKKPELFRVTYKGQVYLDEIAQGLIENLFGTKDVWYACCYVPQNGRNLLLTAPNAEKMRLVHQLAFSTEDPEAYISRIENELSETKKQLAVQQSIYNHNCAELTQQVNKANLDLTLYLHPQDPRRDELPSHLVQLEAQLVRLRKREAEQNQLQGQLQLLEQQLRALGPIVPEPDKDLLCDLETQLEEQRQRLPRAYIYEELVTLRKRLAELQERLLSFTDITEQYSSEDLLRVGDTHARREQEIQKTRKYNIDYTEEALENYKTKLRTERTSLNQVYREEDLLKARIQEEKRKREVAITKKYNIEYTPEAVKAFLGQQQELLAAISFTESELVRSGILQEKQVRGKSLMAQYGLAYTEEARQRGLVNLAYFLEADSFREPAARRQELQQRCDNLKSSEQVITSEMLREHDEKISRAQISASLLRCPHCRQGLRYMEGKLQSSTTEPISPRIIEQLLREREEMQHAFKSQELRNDLAKQLQTVKEELQSKFNQSLYVKQRQDSLAALLAVLPSLPKIPPHVLSELQNVEIISESFASVEMVKTELERARNLRSIITEVSNLEIIQDIPDLNVIEQSLRDRKRADEIEQSLRELESICILPKGPSLELIKRSLNKTHLQDELQRLQEREIVLASEIDGVYDRTEIERKIAELMSAVSLEQKRRSEIQAANQQRRSLEAERERISSLRNDSYLNSIKETEMAIERNHLQQQVIEKYDELLYKKSQLEALQKYIYELHQRLTNLERLRETAVLVEVSALQSTVDSINSTIDDIVPLLFDDPITIRLALFKTLKTKEKTKPQVNLNILYRGGEYDNINQLSGGEGDRVSLVITLALARLCNFPLLLFDESLASLDGELKEAALTAIRQATQKAVACIMHDGCVGLYDTIIEVA